MINTLFLIFVSMFVGGCYALIKKLLNLKNMQVVKGTIVDWKKQMDTSMVIRYVPIVQYMDPFKNALRHEKIETQSSGFRIKPSSEGGQYEYHVIRLAIDKDGDARFLYDVLAKLMIPVAYIVLGLLFSMTILQEL